jgi:hypothetical protein
VPNPSFFARLEAEVETMAGTEAETKETRTKKTGRKGKDVERKDVGSGDKGNENEEDRFFFFFWWGGRPAADNETAKATTERRKNDERRDAGLLISRVSKVSRICVSGWELYLLLFFLVGGKAGSTGRQ